MATPGFFFVVVVVFPDESTDRKQADPSVSAVMNSRGSQVEFQDPGLHSTKP